MILFSFRIILNSLSAHVHICSKISKPDHGGDGCKTKSFHFKTVLSGINAGTGLTMRSHDLSENSLGYVGTATLQVRGPR